MIKVAFVQGYDHLYDKDAVGPYADRLYRELSHGISRQPLKIDYVQLRPLNFLQWIAGLYGILRKYDVVHIQYPLENWGRSVWPGILTPLLKLLFRNTRVIITFHEWGGMHPLRRMSVMPLALCSDGLIFVSEVVRQSFTAGALFKYLIKNVHISLVPVGVSLELKGYSEEKLISERQSLLSEYSLSQNTIVLSFFGFIYDSKQPELLLAVAQQLKSNGLDVLLMVCGDFPVDHGRKKKIFLEKIKHLGLENNVKYFGFVECEETLGMYLSLSDFTLLPYSDGVSTRRTSFWYVLALGVPLITTTPEKASEFSGVCDVESLCDEGRLFFMSPQATPESVCELIQSACSYHCPSQNPQLIPSWDMIREKHFSFYRKVIDENSSCC